MENMRHCIAFIILTLTAFISACGGGGGGNSQTTTTTQYTLGGTISGLENSINTSINGSPFIININGSFTFPLRLNKDEEYTANISTQPSDQICSISNNTGTVKETNVTDINITCVRSTFSISGTINATQLITVDNDINDSSANTNASNNITGNAQIINNLAAVHGFVSAAPTGRSGDRFQFTADDSDYFQANLQAGQVIKLQTIDTLSTGIFSGELTLFLLDSNANIVAQDTAGDEFQEISVPANGLYFILVSATSGATKYVLQLNSTNTLALTKKQSVNIVPNEIIVKYKQKSLMATQQKTNPQPLLSHHKKTRPALARITSYEMTLNQFSKTAVPEFLTELAATNKETYEKIMTLREIKRLNKQDDIEYAEPNYWYQAQRIPNDQHYHFQWHYPLINLPQAWDITTGTPATGQVIIAVIDTGIFLNHVDFIGKLVPGYDFISSTFNSNDGNGIDSDPDDSGDDETGNNSWHGTHVAGTVAANSNNSIGVSGISWGAKIMPIRAIGTQGASSYDIMQSMRFAAGLENDSNTVPAQIADVINMSLGGFGYSQSMQTVIDNVNAAGVIIIAAAGNDNSSDLFYPASYDGVISVSATDIENNKASYSNFGSKIDVAAPGGDISSDTDNDGQVDGILSTLVSGQEHGRSSTYAFFQGTSMASPHVAGIAALMRAVYPALTPEEFKNALIAGALTNEAGDAGRDDIFGYGIIDALKAVQEAQRIENGGTPPAPPALITSTPDSLVLGSQSDAILTLANESITVASITGFSDDANWLSITENTVDNSTKLGTYNISVNRSGLAEATYTANITFNLSTGNTLEIAVSMVVGNISDFGNIGSAYILLINSANNSLQEIETTVDIGNGVYTYSFTNVPAGRYTVAGGSDIDNDLLLCQLGENCGGYPLFSALENIIISNDDVTGIDFTIDILYKTGETNSISRLKH